jgi:hypothetical protein
MMIGGGGKGWWCKCEPKPVPSFRVVCAAYKTVKIFFCTQHWPMW